MYETSYDVYLKTNGAFDITVYPLMVEWGFTNQRYNVPSESRISEILKSVGASKIEYDKESKLISTPEKTEIDFGGIAKGYTSQIITEIFKKNNLIGGVVSLGGNVQTYGEKTDGTKFRIGIENPFGAQDFIGILNVSDKAIITSGGYERYFEKDGVRYHHIIDPKTGHPSNSGLASVTIVNNDGTMADALSTALFVMGKEKAVDYWNKFGKKDEFDIILVEENGNITVTSGIEEYFETDNEICVVY